jgi:hypothetical protein
VYMGDAEGLVYADGLHGSVEEDLRRGAMTQCGYAEGFRPSAPCAIRVVPDLHIPPYVLYTHDLC